MLIWSCFLWIFLFFTLILTNRIFLQNRFFLLFPTKIDQNFAAEAGKPTESSARCPERPPFSKEEFFGMRVGFDRAGFRGRERGESRPDWLKNIRFWSALLEFLILPSRLSQPTKEPSRRARTELEGLAESRSARMILIHRFFWAKYDYFVLFILCDCFG